ncbi:MAG: hypothetical protein BWY82_01532 [Verrucomicrobia bacterium ADurb.Bin474]|nr:MAG: hypothetical protein BWY82_01532 [Verrucomicrobia bacterium ADurb.Bin474]
MDVLTQKRDLTRNWLLKAGKGTQQGGFAGSVWSDDSNEPIWMGFERKRGVEVPRAAGIFVIADLKVEGRKQCSGICGLGLHHSWDRRRSEVRLKRSEITTGAPMRAATAL